MSFGKPKAPAPSADQIALEQSQKEVSAKLDATENERRKRLLNAATGIRAYAGSPLFRAAPSDAAGNAAGAAPAVVTPRGGGGGSIPAGSPGGGRAPGARVFNP